MGARETFQKRVTALRFATTDPQKAASLAEGLGESPSIEAARLMRNGLFVAGFAMLESFVRDRASEIFVEMSRCKIAFADLPPKLQEIATKEAAKALSFQVDLRSRNDADLTSFISSAAATMSTAGSSDFEISPLSFGSSRANISAEDVKLLLNAFQVHDCWSNAGALAARMRMNQLDMRQTFENIRKKRNEAAHRADAEVPMQDLIDLTQQATAIAASIDALLTRAAFVQISRKASKPIPSLVSHSDIPLRFLEFQDGRYRDIGESRKKAARSGVDRSAVLVGCRERASKNGAVIVEIRQNAGVRWEPTDLNLRQP